jgi:hypothetical protein
MKRIPIYLIVLICTLFTLNAANIPSNAQVKLGSLPITFTGLPDDFLYPAYMADPLAVRSEVTYKSFMIDEVVPNANGRAERFDITIGLRIPFFRFSPEGRPDLGIEMDWGMAAPIFMEAPSFDVIAFDGIYYFAIAIRPADWLALRVSRHHICTHIGDELDRNGTGNPSVDFDISVFTNVAAFVRDDFLFSATVEPLLLFGLDSPVSLRLYGDLSLFFYGNDPLLGQRNLKSSDHAYIWYQYGAELEYDIPINHLGGLYAAGQVSAWQLNGFAPNLSISAGYVFPVGKDGQRLKIGMVYYDGQSIMNNFNYHREQYFGAALSIDK